MFCFQLSDYIIKKKQTQPGRTTILVGDMNVANERIDYYNPDDPWMKKQPGTTAQEQSSFQQSYLDNGFVDTFRAMFPNERAYSYFNPRKGPLAYKRREGLRIDYILVGRDEPSVSPSVQLNPEAHTKDGGSLALLPAPYILEEVWSPYSDHCPVGATVPLG